MKRPNPAAKYKLPGSLFQRGDDRWWWRYRLPGDAVAKNRPLVPVGATYATKELGDAVAVARSMLEAARVRTDAASRGFDGTITALVERYKAFAKGYYKRANGEPTTEILAIDHATAPLVALYGETQAADFGPKALAAVREEWIAKRRSRTTINHRIGVIKRAFKWAAGEELIPASVHVGLTMLAGLHKHRSAAKEPKKIRPVDPAVVARTLPHLAPTVADMVRVQMATGMRSTEVCFMRACDIDRTRKTWVYTVPAEANKCGYLDGDEHARRVPLVKPVQDILAPYLLRKNGTEFLFPPGDAQRERMRIKRENRKTPLWPSHLARYARQAKGRTYGPRYDHFSYRRAIVFALNAHNRGLRADLKKAMKGATAKQIAEAYEARKLPHWHPHQLRHLAATIVRAKLGNNSTDAVLALLGQTTSDMADRYAEIRQTLATNAAEAVAKASGVA